MVRLTQAAAIVALSLPAVFADVGLFARQIPGLDPSAIPQTCANQCQAFTSSLQSNPSCLGDMACLCSNTIASGLVSCIDCGYKASPDAFGGNTPDALIKQYTDGCTSLGYTVSVSGGGSGSSASGSGGAGSSASATASGAGSATGSGTGAKPSATSPSSGSSSGGASSPSSTPNGAASTTWNMVGMVAAIAVGATALL